MGFFDIFKKQEPKPVEVPQNDESIKKAKFDVVGSSHYQDAYLQMARPNPDFKKNKRILRKEDKEGVTIYEYLFEPFPAELVSEPENEFDSNAVRVDVKGKCVGYIKKGACSRVKNLLKNKEIISIEVKGYGGKSKSFLDDRDFKEDGYFGCNVIIKYREK